jgi:arsenate reductase (thioredoxin)
MSFAWILALALGAGDVVEQPVALNPTLSQYVQARVAEFDQIPADRRERLQTLAAYVQERVQAGRPVRLTFICTHNSRRSHLSQVWGATAAAVYGVPGVETFSGGTEATAFNPRAVAALRRTGFEIPAPAAGRNPVYQVRWNAAGPAMECFSKVYHEPPNPTREYCAVMTCTQADEACPVVSGAAKRISLPYVDPKEADDTPEEAARYDERTAQIARELLFVFSQIRR